MASSSKGPSSKEPAGNGKHPQPLANIEVIVWDQVKGNTSIQKLADIKGECIPELI